MAAAVAAARAVTPSCWSRRATARRRLDGGGVNEWFAVDGLGDISSTSRRMDRYWRASASSSTRVSQIIWQLWRRKGRYHAVHASVVGADVPAGGTRGRSSRAAVSSPSRGLFIDRPEGATSRRGRCGFPARRSADRAHAPHELTCLCKIRPPVTPYLPRAWSDQHGGRSAGVRTYRRHARWRVYRNMDKDDRTTETVSLSEPSARPAANGATVHFLQRNDYPRMPHSAPARRSHPEGRRYRGTSATEADVTGSAPRDFEDGCVAPQIDFQVTRGRRGPPAR